MRGFRRSEAIYIADCLSGCLRPSADLEHNFVLIPERLSRPSAAATTNFGKAVGCTEYSVDRPTPLGGLELTDDLRIDLCLYQTSGLRSESLWTVYNEPGKGIIKRHVKDRPLLTENHPSPSDEAYLASRDSKCMSVILVTQNSR